MLLAAANMLETLASGNVRFIIRGDSLEKMRQTTAESRVITHVLLLHAPWRS